MLLCSHTFLLFPLKDKCMILTVKTPKMLTEKKKNRDKIQRRTSYWNLVGIRIMDEDISKRREKCRVSVCDREEIFSQCNNY